jgi:transposase
VRPDRDVHEVFRLHTSGLTKAEIARRVGIAHVTVRDWLAAGTPASSCGG